MIARTPALCPVFRRISRLVNRVVSVGALALGLPMVLWAQSSRPGLITQTVNDEHRVTLTGNVHPLATAAADRGLAPASLAEERMLLVLRRSAQQELALQAMIESLHDKNSPNFHKWLTPAQFGAHWGASDADIARITAWLESYGFSVVGPTKARDAIEFSGTAGQVEQAFRTQIHLYEVNGAMHRANASDPTIPTALAPAIAGITSINDFHPRPDLRKGRRVVGNVKAHTARPDLTEQFTGFDILLMGPADAATVYNSPNAALNPAATGTTYTGSGARIGILANSNIDPAQDANYRKLFGLSAKSLIVKADPANLGETDPLSAVEAYLDTEIANGIAPGAQVYLYAAADTFAQSGILIAAQNALDENLVDVLNLSFSECEAALGTADNQYVAALWQQAAAQGISVTVSTGDSGSAGCDDPSLAAPATYGLQVSGLSSTPYNIAVGGTDFAVLAGPDGTGADFTNYVATSGAPGTQRSVPAYIPESPWNDSIENVPPGTLSSNAPFLDTNNDPNIASGGGGKSNCAVGTENGQGTPVCTSGYAKPSWQSGTGVPADTVRDVPDVSFFSGDEFNYAAWGICTDQDTDINGNSIHDCTPGSDGLPADQFYISAYGGTSAAAPTMAGVLALLRQATGQRQGQVDYALYALAKTAPGVFHDVTNGNNSVPCMSGSLNCSLNAAGSYFLTGYNTAAGYDFATGLGSLNISNLITNWASAGLAPTTTTLTVTPTTLQHGLPITASATVTSDSGFASGAVTLTADMGSAATTVGTYNLNAAANTGTINVAVLPGGKYQFIASYGGSTVDAKSVSSPATVSITPEPSTVELGVSGQSGSNQPVYKAPGPVPYGNQLTLTARPYGDNSKTVNGVLVPDGNATGTLKFSAGAVDLGSATVGSNGVAEVTGRLLSPGSYTVDASYLGDDSFAPTVATEALTISKAQTQVKLQVNQTSYQGKPYDFTMTLTTQSLGAAPTGTIELVSGSTVIATAYVTGKAGSGTTLASGSATFKSVNLPDVKEAIEARYSGDANYAASASNVVNVTGAPPFLILTTSIRLPAEHSTSGGTVTVTSTGAYAGTVDITCALISASKSSANPAECGMYPATVTVAAGGKASTEILIFGKGTKLPTGVTLGEVNRWPDSGGWLAGGGAVLACGVLLGIPARRRRWKAVISACLLLVAVAGVTACSNNAKKITAGNYTFRVTGKDSKNPSLTATATVSVEVL